MQKDDEPRAANSTNVLWHQAPVTREHRKDLSGHQSVILWFTGPLGQASPH